MIISDYQRVRTGKIDLPACYFLALSSSGFSRIYFKNKDGAAFSYRSARSGFKCILKSGTVV